MYSYKKKAEGDLTHTQKRRPGEGEAERFEDAHFDNWSDVATSYGMLAVTSADSPPEPLDGA